MANDPIQIKRGSSVDLPELSQAEFAFTTDNETLFIGSGTENIEVVTEGSSIRILKDMQNTAPSDGQVPKWNGAEDRYEPSADEDTTYDSGTGLSLDGTTFSTKDSEIVHDDLSGYEADEHIDWTDSQSEDIHSDNYTDTDTQLSDSEVIDIIDGDDSHGSDASHNYFSGSHDDLSSVDSDDHHSRYTDSEAEDAINNDSDHGSTASHDYTDLSTESIRDLSDVQNTAPGDGQVPTWDDSEGRYEPKDRVVTQSQYNMQQDMEILNTLQTMINGGLSARVTLQSAHDVYIDETGVDTNNSVNHVYSSSGNYYRNWF